MFSSLVRLPLVNLPLNGSRLKFVQISKTANRRDVNRLSDLFHRRSFFNNRRQPTNFSTSNIAPSNRVPNPSGRFSFVLKSTFFTIAVSQLSMFTLKFIPNLLKKYTRFKFGAGCYSTAVIVNYERKLNASKPDSSYFKKAINFAMKQILKIRFFV